MRVPGFGYGGYYELREIIERKNYATKEVFFELKGNEVFADGKIIQGLKIIEDDAYIAGIHYTSWEKATQIRSMMTIEPSLNDPFVYVSESGKMSSWTEKEIKKELGTSSANTEVKLTILVPIKRVWIKASRKVVHFAVEGILHRKEINKLEIKKREDAKDLVRL